MVDVPAKEEVGHWEEDGYWKSDWVYQCNQCGATFSSTDEVNSHQDSTMYYDESDGAYKFRCFSYTQVPGNTRWIVTGKHWVVDEPAQEEQGHWEYR